MKKILSLLVISQMCLAQVPGVNDPSKANLDMLNRDGKLVSIQIVPKQPLQIFVVGKEVAQFDPSELKLIVHRLSPGPKKFLESSRNGDHFIISEPLSNQEQTELEITAKTKKKSETFRFKITTKLH